MRTCASFIIGRVPKGSLGELGGTARWPAVSGSLAGDDRLAQASSRRPATAQCRLAGVPRALSRSASGRAALRPASLATLEVSPTGLRLPGLGAGRTHVYAHHRVNQLMYNIIFYHRASLVQVRIDMSYLLWPATAHSVQRSTRRSQLT